MIYEAVLRAGWRRVLLAIDAVPRNAMGRVKWTETSKGSGASQAQTGHRSPAPLILPSRKHTLDEDAEYL